MQYSIIALSMLTASATAWRGHWGSSQERDVQVVTVTQEPQPVVVVTQVVDVVTDVEVVTVVDGGSPAPTSVQVEANPPAASPTSVQVEASPSAVSSPPVQEQAGPPPAPTTLVTHIIPNAPSSTVVATPQPTGGSSDLTADQQAALDAHNAARAAVKVEPLVWNATLAAGAQDYVNYLAANKVFKHSGADGVGENLYMESKSDAPYLHSANAYISEKSDYNGKAIDSNNYSHYTQVVWRATTDVGMAVATADNGDLYVVCRYYTAGNFMGQMPY